MGEERERYEAFVTLATNDTYALGALVLGNSLRRVGTTRQLVVMVTDGVSSSLRGQLSGTFDHIFPVNVLDSNDAVNLELLGRPDLSVTFTKLHCWRLTQFRKAVFLDADTLVIQNVDDLFDREELSAAPDVGWPDCFNSGVFVFVPSEETYRNLLTFAVTAGSFDGGDQGLLNSYFSSWATADIGRHLPFLYNVVSQAFYSYLPALKQFHSQVKIVHFIGPVKPWHHSYNTATGQVAPLPNTSHDQEFLQLWWDTFMDSVQPHLDPQLNVRLRLEHRPPPPHIPPASQSVQDTQPNAHFPYQRDHHGHGDIRAQPTISFQIVYPYQLPILDSPLASRDEESPPRVIEVPVVYRYYSSFETHYPEEPLSAVNPESPPLDHYFSSQEIKRPEFDFRYLQAEINDSQQSNAGFSGEDNAGNLSQEEMVTGVREEVHSGNAEKQQLPSEMGESNGEEEQGRVETLADVGEKENDNSSEQVTGFMSCTLVHAFLSICRPYCCSVGYLLVSQFKANISPRHPVVYTRRR